MRAGCALSVMVVLLRDSRIRSRENDKGQQGSLLHDCCSPNTTYSPCQQRDPLAAKRIRSPQIMKTVGENSDRNERAGGIYKSQMSKCDFQSGGTPWR